MDGRPPWTDCDEAGDYVVPNVLSPRDLVFRPDNKDETVPHQLPVRKGKTQLRAMRMVIQPCAQPQICIPILIFPRVKGVIMKS